MPQTGRRADERRAPDPSRPARPGPRGGSTGADDPDATLDLFDPRITHQVTLIDRGPFLVARCSGCGWESFARRSRGLARREGRDHELLFAPAG